MLNPNGAETTPTGETESVRQRARPEPPRPVNIDPSWRAGQKLEEARRQLGLSFEQVSNRIKVRKEYLEALESMNAKLLPGKAYALAYLRSYAALLGLDAQAIVEQFQDECALSREDARAQVRLPTSRPHPERPWLAAVALVAITASFMGLRAWQDSRPDTVSAQDVGAAPAAADQTTPTHVGLEIRAIATGWLEIRGPDGTVFLSKNFAPGESYAPDASAGWTIHARDGGAFELYVDGQPAGPLGPPGMPVLGRQIDEIRALPQSAAPLAPALAALPPAQAASASAPVAETPRPRAAAPAPTPVQPASAEAPAAEPAQAAPEPAPAPSADAG